MANETEMFSIEELTEASRKDMEAMVATEFQLTILLNDEELVTLACSPTNLKYLVVGFLFSEGLIGSKDEIKKIIVDDRRGVARVKTEEDKRLASELLFKRLITSGCGRGASFYSAADVRGLTKVESQILISAHEVFALVNEFQHRSKVYSVTHGVHSAVLCNAKELLLFSDDIGRHNAIDKILGECLLKSIRTDDHIIITTGRISSEMLLKVAKRNIPIIISISAPTNLGVRLAADLGVTLVGLVRGKKMVIYTHSWRVTK